MRLGSWIPQVQGAGPCIPDSKEPSQTSAAGADFDPCAVGGTAAHSQRSTETVEAAMVALAGSLKGISGQNGITIDPNHVTIYLDSKVNTEERNNLFLLLLDRCLQRIFMHINPRV